MKQGLPDLQPQALILPAGPEALPPTAAQFRDPAGEPLIPRDPRGYFQLSGSSSRQDSCIKAAEEPRWLPFSVPFRGDGQCCCCSVTQSSPTLWKPMDYNSPGFPIHYLPEFTHTHVHRVGDAIHHLILCYPLLLLPSIFPSIRVFSNESALHIR